MLDIGVSGAGLGLRRSLLSHYETLECRKDGIQFLECAPENWIDVGGGWRRRFEAIADRFPLVCHGLSLSLGTPAQIDVEHVKKVGAFLNEFGVRFYSEHLSYTGDEASVFELCPIPFTEDGVRQTADNIKLVQDVLGRQIGVENVSYYTTTDGSMPEHEFVNQVLEAADCLLLLDVNNLECNRINHGTRPQELLQSVPHERVAYLHIAGHKPVGDMVVDTHGEAVIDEVWSILDQTYGTFGAVPTLLERDSNFPAFEELLAEISNINQIMGQHSLAA